MQKIEINKDEVFEIVIKDGERIVFKDYVKAESIDWKISEGISIKLLAVATNLVYKLLKNSKINE